MMTMTPADAKATFPALRDRTFLDAACVSLIAQPVYDAVRGFLDLCLQPEAGDASLHHIEMDEARPRTVAEAVRLLNADPASVALVESTSHGLNIVASALPLSAGDRVLIADTEFLQVAIPWQVRAKRDGLSDRELARRRETVFRLLETLEVVEVTRPVLSRAAQPMPTELGTLDAIHLATALLWQEASGRPLTFATHDSALGLAARASGMPVVGV